MMGQKRCVKCTCSVSAEPLMTRIAQAATSDQEPYSPARPTAPPTSRLAASQSPSRRRHRQPRRAQHAAAIAGPNPHSASSPRRRLAPLAICGGSRATSRARDGLSAAVPAPRPPCAIAVARSCAPTAEGHSCRCGCGRRRALSTGRSPAAARSHSSARTPRPARSHLSRALVSSPAVSNRLGRGVAWGSLAQRSSTPLTVFLRPVFSCFVASWRSRARLASVPDLASARA